MWNALFHLFLLVSSQALLDYRKNQVLHFEYSLPQSYKQFLKYMKSIDFAKEILQILYYKILTGPYIYLYKPNLN